ncbi:hypothetical protein SLEP1_g28406 [Rubroshorea leprosula]|uniref:FLZ-type domain-containing protein n=1 Tax=Rubroshorea leprosula TaxID=152421 RepID=A0AAV5JTK0_9ROSI|nr:hypothetical protein SLEP1_g28406 [Rubroshorea leprosula]
MMGKRPRPIIGKLSELLVSVGNHTVVSDVITSPRSPLNFKIQSPKSMKNYDLGGVGLGIVAALEKSGDCCGRLAVRCSNLSRLIAAGKVLNNSRKSLGACGDWESENLENYTYVTCHGPNNKSFTKVYYDGHEQKESNIPVPPKEPVTWFLEDVSPYPTSDFLSSCHLCRKNLHGKDIYMYRGEKGFCSSECRSRQIMMDERREQQCRSEASRSGKVTNSAHNAGQIFWTGILAT